MAIVVLTCAGSTLTCAAQSGALQARRLDPRIQMPAPQLYESITDARNWKNPYLVVRRDGIEVVAAGIQSGRSVVAVADLQRTLIDLPPAAWPYGTVVGLMEIGIRAGDGSDAQSIADNLAATLLILKNLAVTVGRWPS